MGTLVGSSVNTQYTSTGTACAVTLPAGIQAGDIILVFLGHGNAATYSSTTAGFTNDVTISNGTACTAARFSKTAAGTEGGTTFNTTLSSNSTRFLVAQVWRGVTLDSVNGTNTGSSSTPGDAAITATSQPGVAVGFGAGRGAADGSTVAVSSAPTGYTLDTQQTSGLGSTNRNTGGGTYYKASTSTTISAASATFNQSTSWATITTSLIDSASVANADATVTDTYGVTADANVTSPANATVTDTYGVSASASATTPGVEIGDASSALTFGTSADASVTSPADASSALTFGASATANRIDSASASPALTFGTDASASAVSPFPFGPNRIKVALDLDGSGAFATDITQYVKLEQGIEITRGMQSEGQTAGPASCGLTLLNRKADGYPFNRRNPTGPWFGQLTNNTPIQISIPHIVTRLVAPVGVDSAMSTPDTASLSVTGDIDLRADVQLGDWSAGGTGISLIQKWNLGPGQGSYVLHVNADGTLALWWSANGSTQLTASSTACIPVGPKRQVLRATLDVNNGASGRTARFYSADAGNITSGPWTQIGADVVQSGTTSIFDSVTLPKLGHTSADDPYELRFFGVQIWNGIDGAGGTIAADLDLTKISDGATTVTDAQGHVWTPKVGAELQTRDKRFTGVAPSWPMEHGLTDEDCEVQIVAADVRRRLGRSSAPLKSVFSRACTSTVAPISGLKAYWPCEDGDGATRLASGLTGGLPATITGTPDLAKDSKSFTCSSPLLDMGTGTIKGNVSNYAATGYGQVRWLMAMPEAGITTGAVIASIRTSGTAARWELVYTNSASATLTLNVYDAAGASLLSDGPYHMTNGRPVRTGISLTQNGTAVDYMFFVMAVGERIGDTKTGTLASRTVGAVQSVTLGPNADLAGVVIGQVMVQSVVTAYQDMVDELNANTGEVASTRISRLCREEGVGFAEYGVGGLMMGYQRPGKLIDLLQEAETTDGGILFSPRDRSGLAYRSTDSMCARTPCFTGAYSSSGLNDLTPVDDDQATANDVTITRIGGVSVRAVQESGPLSIQDPPNGVGLYDEGGSTNVSLASDSSTDERAWWALHLGTVDEPRVPSVTWDLSAGPFADGTTGAALTLARTVRDLDVGDRIVITDVPGWSSPDDVDQVLIGFREYLAPHEHQITGVCRPYSPFRVGVYDDDASRYSGDGTVLAGSLTTTATSVPVTAPDGVIWTHADGDFPVATGGEEMTVTGVSGTAPNFTFTVVRSVNGVIKAHTAGAGIDVARPVYYEM